VKAALAAALAAATAVVAMTLVVRSDGAGPVGVLGGLLTGASLLLAFGAGRAAP
jgi:hypothetical protein